MSDTNEELYVVWFDDKKADAIAVQGSCLDDVLDKAAQEFGYVDYQDMGQALNWGENEGLNICTAGKADYYGVTHALE